MNFLKVGTIGLGSAFLLANVYLGIQTNSNLQPIRESEPQSLHQINPTVIYKPILMPLQVQATFLKLLGRDSMMFACGGTYTNINVIVISLEPICTSGEHLKWIYTHEGGHLVGVKLFGASADPSQSPLGAEFMEALRVEGSTPYGDTHPREAFAEAFAECFGASLIREEGRTYPRQKRAMQNLLKKALNVTTSKNWFNAIAEFSPLERFIPAFESTGGEGI